MLRYFKPVKQASKLTPIDGNCVDSVKPPPSPTCSPTPSTSRLSNSTRSTTSHASLRGLELEEVEQESPNKRNWSAADQEGNEEQCPPPSKKLKTTEQRLKWRKISADNLDCDYAKLYSRHAASALLQECERELKYFTSQDLTRVQVYGKWHDIPRKQVAHGDSGLTYKYSGVTIPAVPWTPLLTRIRNRIQQVTGVTFNFVLINRYKDGTDYMGEHRDDEEELVPTSPIASLSLGQARDFVFRHGESRGKNATRSLAPVKLVLEHGSLLMMNYPSNVYWYHSLPVRRKAVGTRINMTFRCLKT